jgi:hypothetical protein
VRPHGIGAMWPGRVSKREKHGMRNGSAYKQYDRL